MATAREQQAKARKVAGYGGQFLMVNMTSGRVAAFLSVLENESGYDEDYMLDVITKLEALCVG